MYPMELKEKHFYKKSVLYYFACAKCGYGETVRKRATTKTVYVPNCPVCNEEAEIEEKGAFDCGACDRENVPIAEKHIFELANGNVLLKRIYICEDCFREMVKLYGDRV